jgi:predicted transcriptional regulator
MKKANKAKKVTVTCRLDAKDVNVLDKLAARTDRDRSYLIKEAVSDFIAMQEWQEKEVKLAMAEIDAGKGITWEEFEADVKTWDK